MKKLSMLIIFLLLSNFVFSQSKLLKMAQGYRETYWKEPLSEILQNKQLKKGNINSNYVEYLENAKILKENTDISYLFENNKLVAIGYSLEYTSDKKERLLSTMDRNGYVIKESKNFDGRMFDIKLIKQFMDEGKISSKEGNEQIEVCKSINNLLEVLNDVKTYEINQSSDYSLTGVIFAQQNEIKDTYQLTLAKYRDFTNVYVFFNLLNKIYVVYTEVEEDEI